MKTTSKEALLAIAKTLKAKQAFAYNLITRYPLRTARELEQLCGDPSVHKRLTELESRGIVFADEPRACSLTGRNAVVWRLRQDTDPAPPKPIASRQKMRDALGSALAMVLAQKSGLAITVAETDEVLQKLRAVL